MIATEFKRILRDPVPLLMTPLFMLTAIFLVGFFSNGETFKDLQPVLFWISLCLSLKMGFGQLLQEEQKLGILHLVAKSPHGLLRFLRDKILIHSLISGLMASALALMLGVFDQVQEVCILFLVLGILYTNQTTFELLLSPLRSRGGLHMLSALLIFPLEIPILLSALATDLTFNVKIQILIGLLLVAGCLLTLSTKLLIPRQSM